MKNKNYILPVMAAALVAAATSAESVRFSSYKATPATGVRLPAMTDSTDNAGNKFSVKQLLKNPTNFDLSGRSDLQTLEGSDSLATVELPLVGEQSISILQTRIRPERFMKGKLVVKTPAAYEAYKNGEAIAPDGAMTLEAEETAVITFKVLTAEADSARTFSAEFVPDKDFEDVQVTVDPNMKYRFAHRNTYQGMRVRSTALSADGKYLITNYSETFTPGETNSYRELTEVATGKAITRNISKEARWLSSGSRLYYTAEGQSGSDLIFVEVPSMKETVVARNLPDDRFYIAPDESFVLYYTKPDAPKQDGPLKRYGRPDDRIPGNLDRSYLMRYDFSTGLATPLLFGGESPYLMDIRQDSKKIVYTVTNQTPSKFPFYYTDLIELDLNTLQTDTLVHADPSIKSVIYSPDGKKLFIYGGPIAFNNLGKNCGDYPIANDYDVQGYLFDIASRTAKAATFDFDPSLAGQPVWNRADNQIYFQAESGFCKLLYRMNPETLKIEQLPTEIDRITGFSIGENEANWLTYSGESTEYAGRAYLLNLRKGTNKLIADPLQPMLQEINFGKTDSWKFTAQDGVEVDGIFCLPPDFDPAKKYPMIVYYYGGTLPTYKGMSHPYVPELFASRGYVVYMPNPSGTAGYGQEYSARHVNAWGDYTADEIIDGVKQFCAEHPYVDSSKVGCIGASYGGFMTQYLLTRTDIFAAGVSHAGISNIPSYWGEGYWGYSYSTVASAGQYPWTDPQQFSHGSLMNADKIHTPLLLLHGTVDTNVPIGESIQLFNALKILGRPVEFVTVDGENHYIADLNKQAKWHATIMAWFARYLQDDPRWWNALYPDSTKF
jgi:dipeptidyl aminopeptidase/acylaminoacyl peptidase